MSLPEEKLKELNLKLPPPPKPLGAYKPVQQVGHCVYLSGTLPLKPDGKLICGKLGKDLTIEEGREAARWATLNALAAVRDYFGALDRVSQVIRAVGYIRAAEDFGEHAQVLNGASDLLAELFGDQGRHARLALGVSSLPKNASIELELILEIDGPANPSNS